MSIMSVARLARRWRGAAGVALVTALAVVGAYVEASPVQRYGGLHLTSHPPLVAYLVLAVPALTLIWRNRRPVGVLGLVVCGAASWAALGQIDGAALVPVIVGVYWVALTRPWRVAVAAGFAGAVAIFVTEGLLGPFGWFGGPNATMWPELLTAGAFGAYVAARRQWLAAYCIVQESLTNVVRHAGRVAATVGLRHDGGYPYMDVVNDGGAAPAAFSDGTGAGPAGMRERAAALGGTLDAGPRPGGGFAVRARLPVTTDALSQDAGFAGRAGGPRAQPIASRP